MFRALSLIALVIFSVAPARCDEVKGKALVAVEDPQQGSIPQILQGQGTIEPETIKNESFQRDGMISEIYVEVGDQFKKGDKLLDFGASPAAVLAYKQALTTLQLAEGTLAHAQQAVEAEASDSGRGRDGAEGCFRRQDSEGDV